MEDKEMIMATLHNYVDGWFEGDSKRMELALHKNLAKRHFYDNKVEELDYGTMIEFTKKGYGKENKPAEGTIKIEILSIDGHLASAKLETIFIDFVHLVKVDKQWKILNVLWDYIN
jgi:hypothetical protein